MKYQFKKLILIKSIILITIMVDDIECQHDYQQKQDNIPKANSLASLNITKKSQQSQLTYFYQTGVYADFSNPSSISGQLLQAITSSNDGCSKYLNKNLPNVYVSFVVKNSKCTYSDLINYAIQSNASALIVKTSAESDSLNFNNNIQFESKLNFIFTLLMLI